jgi:hypothetical protein
MIDQRTLVNHFKNQKRFITKILQPAHQEFTAPPYNGSTSTER